MAGRAFLWAGALLLGAAVFTTSLVVRPMEAPQASEPAPQTEPVPRRLSAQLPAGEEAITIRLDPVRGLNGMLRGGDHVDVYGYFPPAGEDEPAATQLLQGDARVREVISSGDAHTLVVALSPQRALFLQAATQLGARPFVSLCSAASGCGPSGRTAAMTDADLVNLLTRRAGSSGDRSG